MNVPGSPNPLLWGGGDPIDELFAIKNSVRFNRPDAAFLSRTPAANSNRTTWTFSAWLKLANVVGANVFGIFVNHGDGGTYRDFLEIQSDQIRFDINSQALSWAGQLKTDALYRDTSSHMHVVAVFDSTNATGADRMRLYVNGERITSFSSQTIPAQNATSWTNGAGLVHRIGVDPFAGSAQYFDGYLSNIDFIDGLALDATAFGTFHPKTGQWRPKKYAGTYGTNGFRLDFSDGSAATGSALGKDRSGNNNDWTPSNISVAAGVGQDWITDTPTTQFCIMSPTATLTSWSAAAIQNGGLDVKQNYSASINSEAIGSMSVSSGKWYWETLASQATSPNAIEIFGVAYGNDGRAPWVSGSYGVRRSNGNKYINGSASAFGAGGNLNDVYGIALDLDAGTLTIYKNGVSMGVLASGLPFGLYTPWVWMESGNTTAGLISMNFGQRSFAYAPPSGHKALCAKNLPMVPTVMRSKDKFDIALYTGNGAARSISGLRFSPDLVWIKARSFARSHRLFDRNRGPGNLLEPNLTNAEIADAQTLTAFDSSGFSLGTSAETNNNGETMVAWNWKAGGGAVANNVGSIAAQVNVDQAAGISVMTYAKANGAVETVGHGLGVKPAMVMVKSRGSSAENWNTWIKDNGSAGNGVLWLNSSGALQSLSTVFNGVEPTASIITLGAAWTASNHLAIAFAEVPGFSKFGSYIGNGNAEGPEIKCGFRPAFVMVKRLGAAGNWQIYDTTRRTYNPNFWELVPNSSEMENSVSLNIPVKIDFTAAGFKIRDTDASANASTDAFAYAAFAEFPFRYANAR